MASSCFSAFNGSLASPSSVSTRSDGRTSTSPTPRSLHSFRPLDLRTLSLTFSRKSPLKHSYPGLVHARAELSTEELEALDAPVEDSDLGSPSDLDDTLTDEAKLYVGNLPWSCTSQELAECFQKVGSVEVVEVIYDRASGRSRGFGFVTMSSMEDANSAIQKLDGADYAGRTLRVNFPNRNRGDVPPPRAPRVENNTNKLFVGNLAWGVDNNVLEQVFSEHGKVLEARVVQDRDTGRSRGFGFVTMGSEAEVNEALNKMDGAFIEGRNIRVNIAGDKPASRTDFF